MVNRRTISLGILLGLTTLARGFSSLPRKISNESDGAITVLVDRGKEFGKSKDIKFDLKSKESKEIETAPDFDIFVEYSNNTSSALSFHYYGSRHEINSLSWKGPSLITIYDNAIRPSNTPNEKVIEISRLPFGGVPRPNFNRPPSAELF